MPTKTTAKSTSTGRRRPAHKRACPPAPAVRGTDWELKLGDALYQLKKLPTNSVHAVVTDPPYAYNGGIYGQAWDRQSAAHTARFWQEVLRVLRPGGHVLAFAAANTYHRLATALEESGFELRDQFMWLRGHGRGAASLGDQVAAAGGDAEQWSGWVSNIRPGHEPIAVARKPLEGSLADNLVKWRTGGLNSEACRSPITTKKAGRSTTVPGRRPSTVVIGPEAAAVVDQQSGYSRSRHNPKASASRPSWHSGSISTNRGARGYDDEGGAARFFYNARAVGAERRFGLPKGVEAHETTKPLELMRWLVRMVTPPAGPDGEPAGVVLDPFAGSGSTGGAALMEGFRFVGFERHREHARRARWRLRAWEQRAADERAAPGL